MWPIYFMKSIHYNALSNGLGVGINDSCENKYSEEERKTIL